MNKFYTVRSNKNDEHFEAELSDEKLMKKSEYGIKLQKKPAKTVMDFLLNFSKSLEVKRGCSYSLN